MTQGFQRLVAMAVVVLLCVGAGVPTLTAQTIGAGAQYWKAVNDIKIDDIDEDGLAWLASVQFPLGDLVQLEGTLEVFPEGFAGQTETSYAPQAALLVGTGLYGGVGIGVNYADGDFADDPFYFLRAGVLIEILPGLALDLNAQYRFQEWDDLEDDDRKVSGDTVMLAALLRLSL